MTTFYTLRGIPGEIKDEFKLTCLKRHETAGQVVSRLMLEHIALSGFETKLWKGFTPAPWNTLTPGEEVFIAGSDRGKPRAYGPHVVVNPQRKVLKNLKGVDFLVYQDVLLKRR